MDILNDISVIPTLLLVAILGGTLWADLRHGVVHLVSGRNVVLCGIAAWYLLEAYMLPKDLRKYDQSQYNFGILCVGLALMSFLAGYHYTAGCKVFPSFGEKITFFDDDRRLWRLVVIGALIGFAPVVYFTGTEITKMLQDVTGMRSTWGGVLGRGRYGDARAAFLMLEMFVGGVAPFAAILLLGRNSTVLQRVFCALVVAWPILRGYGSGTRSSLIVATATILAVLYWKATPTRRKQLILASLVSIPMLYGLMAALVASRSSGSFSWESGEKVDYVGNEMFRELLFITSKFPAEVGYQFGFGYYVQLVNPIPRFLWPDKPTLDAGIFMAQLYGEVTASGEAHLTISPGIIGEMYLNFGIIGVIALSAFGGWLVKGWDIMPKLYSHSLPTMMYYSGGLAVLFIMGRSFTMGMFYGLLSLAVLAWLVRSLNPLAVTKGNVANRNNPVAI